jgi:hypothetical protein
MMLAVRTVMAGDMSDSKSRNLKYHDPGTPERFPDGGTGIPSGFLMDDNLDVNPEDTGISSGDIPVEDEVPATEDEAVVETDLSDIRPAKSQVNLLANRSAGPPRLKKKSASASSGLPGCLCTTGFLSQEMRDIILHLAEVATDSRAGQRIPASPISLMKRLLYAWNSTEC